MAGYNRVILMGNLTRNPELRYTPKGTAVSDVSLAVNTTWGRSENRKEETLFMDCTVWGRQAEVICEYTEKGSPLLVEGRLVQDTWEDRESGQKRSKIKMTIESFQFLGGRDGAGGGGGGGGGRSQAPRRQQQRPPRQEESFDEEFDGGDDIPF